MYRHGKWRRWWTGIRGCCSTLWLSNNPSWNYSFDSNKDEYDRLEEQEHCMWLFYHVVLTISQRVGGTIRNCKIHNQHVILDQRMCWKSQYSLCWSLPLERLSIWVPGPNRLLGRRWEEHPYQRWWNNRRFRSGMLVNAWGLCAANLTTCRSGMTHCEQDLQ
jgi:hypothetical protein